MSGFGASFYQFHLPANTADDRPLNNQLCPLLWCYHRQRNMNSSDAVATIIETSFLQMQEHRLVVYELVHSMLIQSERVSLCDHDRLSPRKFHSFAPQTVFPRVTLWFLTPRQTQHQAGRSTRC